jgi:hypothetical protein
MEQILERVQKVVTEYNPQKPGSRAKSIRSLLAAVIAVRKYIDERSEEDRGCAQRLTRELDDVLCELPDFKELSDKQAQASRHTKRLAEEHLDEIETYLKKIVAEDEAGKKKQTFEWVNTHPIFGELKRAAASKSLPKRAYILLFKKAHEDKLELLTRKTPENAVISRFRPHEFTDEMRVSKAYQRQPIVGAAVINEQELITVLGEVPQPRENQTQLQALLALSKEAVGRPAQQFIESNPVLKQLFDMARRRKMPKDAYVLLFQMAEADSQDVYVADIYEDPAAKQNAAAQNQAADQTAALPGESDADTDQVEGQTSEEHPGDHEGEASGHTAEDSEQEDAGGLGDHADSAEGDLDEDDSSADDGGDAETDQATSGEDQADSEELSDAEHGDSEHDDDASATSDDSGNEGDPVEQAHDGTTEEAAGDAPAEHELENAGQAGNAEESNGEAAESASESGAGRAGGQHKTARHKERRVPVVAPPTGPINCNIVVRKTSDGKIITRFWSADFAVKHKVFDEFKEKPPVIGAAIIKRTDLVRVLGRVPVAGQSQSRFDALMQASRSAVEKPSLEFVTDNEVLKALHDLSVSDTAHRDACVILFVLGEHGRVEVPSGEGAQATLPLGEFRFAKAVHDRFFAKPAIIGASVVAPGVAPPSKAQERPRDDRSKSARSGNDQRRDSAPKPSVIAAFGRTPLKVSLLATAENFTRLGIAVDASRLFETDRFARPPQRPFGKGPRPGGGRDSRDNRGPRDNRESKEGRGPQGSAEPRGSRT